MELTLILPRVYVGSCPVEPADIDQLKELGITAVFSLQTEEDFLFWGIDWPALESAYRKMDIELVRIPVQDFSPEDLREKLPACVAALEKLLQAGHTVFVHCSAGVNRSPSVVVAYLHWTQHMPLEEALEYVRQRRPCDPYADSIRLAAPDP
ncbi:MAG TPA: dual specificity protein phosphatase family protein [Thermoguttaceae bacterium]|nr:dual specificity protein phosphatase family protein [Thermoguttaceae bacterium]